MHSLPVSFSAHHFNLLQYNNLFPPCVFNYQVQNLWPRFVRLSSPSMIHNIKPWILVKEHRAVSKYPIKITSWPQKLHLMTSGIKCLKLSQKGFRLDPKWVWLLWKFRGNNRQEPVSASYSFQQCDSSVGSISHRSFTVLILIRGRSRGLGMSLQEIQYNYLDSAKEMFACGLVLLCVTVEISRFESLTETQVGYVPQTMSTAVVKLGAVAPLAVHQGTLWGLWKIGGYMRGKNANPTTQNIFLKHYNFFFFENVK